MFIPLTPLRCLHRAVDLYARKIGVVCGEKQFTYAEFGARCEKLAGALAVAGICPGDRVACLSFNTHQLLEAYFGVVQAHAIVMPLNVRLTAAELAAILQHAEPRMLFFENEFAATVAQLRASCPGIERFVSLDDPVDVADLTYEELLATGRAERADIFAFEENSVAELFYTSGSTGAPKGVALSHRTLYLHALSVATVLMNDDSYVDLHTIPLFHANGWGRPQCSTLMGLKQVMVRRFEPTTVFSLIEKHRATHMALVPTMGYALLNSPDIGKYDLSSLKLIMFGGAASSPELIERMERTFGCTCVAGYGLTETAPVVTLARPKSTLRIESESERYRRQAHTGWAIPNVELRVVDPHMRDVPKDGQTMGEIVVRSDHVMEGYYKEPAETAAAITDGWLHTGDMAVWDEEDFVLIMDRKKDIIISGGENISSLEIEKAILAHPDVYECAVVSSPDPHWGETPAAIVHPKPETSLSEEGLREFLATRLAKFKIPRHIQFTEVPLPKTGTGKIRKRELREQFWAGKEKRVQG